MSQCFFLCVRVCALHTLCQCSGGPSLVENPAADFNKLGVKKVGNSIHSYSNYIV